MSDVNEKRAYLSEAEKELHSGNIPMLFRKFAIPGVISLLFLGLQTIVDGIVIGNFVGANALASVNLTLPCYSFVGAVCIVMGVGAAAMVSIRLGEQDRQGANDAARSAITALWVFSAAVSILIFIFAPEIVTLLGANDVLRADSAAYIRSLIPFYPALTTMFFCDNILKATGNPVFATSMMTTAVILNIILDLLFVAVLDMGTGGAGLATGLAFTFPLIGSVPKVFGKKNIIEVFKGRYKGKLVWMMFYNGSSEGLTEFSVGITTLLFNITMMKYLGEAGVAAFTAINYVFFISLTIILGVSNGIIPIISYNFGADQWERIRKTLWLAIRTNFIIGAVIFLALTFFAREIISLFFRSGETEVIDIAVKGTSVFAYALFIIGFNILASGYFTAIANAKLSIIISLLRALVFVAVGIFIFTSLFGIDGVWLAVPAAELLTLAVSVSLVVWSVRKGRAMKNMANI